MKDNFVIPICVLAIICLVVAGLLAFVNDITYPIIKSSSESRIETSMRDIMPKAPGFEPVESEGFSDSVREVYRATDDSGYIFIVTSFGFGGDIKIICGIDSNGNIIEVRTEQHFETKGLGDYIENRSFTEQFDGLTLNRLSEVDTVTGASVTFNAFIKAIEEAFNAFEIIKSGN